MVCREEWAIEGERNWKGEWRRGRGLMEGKGAVEPEGEWQGKWGRK